MALLLALPTLRFPYLFDDYDFLNRILVFRASLLLPDPGIVFYRPISRELYFSFLQAISPGNALLGHVINAIALGVIVFLGSRVATRLAGVTVGLATGLLLASFGQWPVLVGWVSGCQDLFAIALALLAIDLELSGKTTGSLCAFVAAILSKETAIAVAPALLATRWLRVRGGKQTVIGILQISAILICWALIHPGVRLLLERGATAPQGSYIQVANSARLWASLRNLPVLLNLPLARPLSFPMRLLWIGAVALVPFLIGLRELRTLESRPEPGINADPQLSPRQLAVFGALLSIPPLLLTCFLTKLWPYYFCFPAVGLCIAAGGRLGSIRFPVAAAGLALFYSLGVWSRAASLEPGVLTEQALALTKALPQVERNFKRLVPSLPPGSVVYVTTMATGPGSVYAHIYRYQALRVWYREPTIETLRPSLRVLSSGPEFLFGINSKLNVFQIDLQSLRVRSAEGPVDRSEYRNVMRSHSIGLAGTGDLNRAVQVLSATEEPYTMDWLINRRIAAMLCLSRGEPAAAAALLRGLPGIPLGVAFNTVWKLLTIPTPGMALEEHALRAFDFSPADPVVIRKLLRVLLSLGYDDVSKRLAQRLLLLQPGDREATAALDKINSRATSTDLATPVPSVVGSPHAQ